MLCLNRKGESLYLPDDIQIQAARKEIEFEFERATKNTYRFQEKTTGSPVIGTLYVQKSVFGSKEPKRVKVTVEWQ